MYQPDATSMPQQETDAINRLYNEVHGIRNDLKQFMLSAENDIRGLMVNSERIAARAEGAVEDVTAVRKRLFGVSGDSGEMRIVADRLADLEHERWKRHGAGLLWNTVTTAIGVLAALAAAYGTLAKAGMLAGP